MRKKQEYLNDLYVLAMFMLILADVILVVKSSLLSDRVEILTECVDLQKKEIAVLDSMILYKFFDYTEEEPTE